MGGPFSPNGRFSTFHPGAAAPSYCDLEAEWIQQQFSSALGLAVDHSGRIAKTGCGHLGESLYAALTSDPAQRDHLLLEPAFRVWISDLARSVIADDETRVTAVLKEWSDLAKRIAWRRDDKSVARASTTRIPVLRYDIDPVLQRATPPSYTFEHIDAAVVSPEGSVVESHSTWFMADVIGLALENIRLSWPELCGFIERTVRCIGYVPDADFRSCSAARFAGAILIGSQDESIADLEESIVHEAGHQALYMFDDLRPIIDKVSDNGAQYRLPWSGSERDLFGFYHAFYIYVLLVKYLDCRIERASGTTKADLIARRSHIVDGLRRATPMLLAAAPSLTEDGCVLLDALICDVELFRERKTTLFDRSEAPALLDS